MPNTFGSGTCVRNWRLRKRKAQAAERNLIAAHERLKDAFEVVPEALALFDTDDRFVLWNRRYKEIHAAFPDVIRVGGKFEEVLRVGLANGLYPEAVGREHEWLAERLAHHALPQSTAEYRIGDRWLRVEERRTADGGSVGIRVDITDLKKSQESFRLLFDSNPLPMFLYDLETKAILGANDSMVSHYGYSRERLLCMNLRDLRDPADYNKPFQHFTETHGVQNATSASRHRKADGTDISVMYYVRQLIHEGRIVGLTAIVDITEQQRATDELRTTREFLNTVIENVPSAILVRDTRAIPAMRWSIAPARNFTECRANASSATRRRSCSARRSPTAFVLTISSCYRKVAAWSPSTRSRRMADQTIRA